MGRIRSAFDGRFWAVIIGGLLIGALIFAITMIWRGSRGETIVLQVMPVDDPNIVRVYVGGEVVQPALYSLPRGSRISDALQAAGGPTSAGDTSGFGMAAVVEDSDQIIVPARRAVVPSPTIPPVSGGSGTATAVPEAPVATLININTALASELDRLPGIGPALSARIIEYRETNGPFRTVDELAAIRGISERMVDEMRPMITVGP